MNKKFLSGVLSCALASSMLLTGCQGASTQSKAPESTGGASSAAAAGQITSDPVELRFSWWGSDNRHKAIQEVIALYEKKHPNVKIKAEYGAWDGWQQNILTQLGGQTEADIIQVNYNWVHSFGKGKNVFLDLNTVSDYLKLDNWDSNYLKAMEVSGEQAAVPHGMTARAFLYSKPLFEQSKLSYPTTYQELMDAGKVIGKNNTATGAENKYVLLNIGKECPDLFIAQMLYNKTGKVMQVAGKVQYTEQEVAAALEQYNAFAKSGAMPTFQQQNAMANESNPDWTSGRGGSIYEWIGTMDKYLNSYKGGKAKEEIAVAPYLVEKAGETPNIYVKPNLGYAISKNSKNPQVAADFLNFFFTDEEAVTALGTSIGISSNSATLAIQEKAGLLKGIMKDGYDMLAKYPQTVLDPYFEDSNVRGARYAALEAYRSGKLSSAEAAKQYISKQQEELDKLFK